MPKQEQVYRMHLYGVDPVTNHATKLVAVLFYPYNFGDYKAYATRFESKLKKRVVAIKVYDTPTYSGKVVNEKPTEKDLVAEKYYGVWHTYD